MQMFYELKCNEIFIVTDKGLIYTYFPKNVAFGLSNIFFSYKLKKQYRP